MAISTLQVKSRTSFYNILVYVLAFFGVVFAVYLSVQALSNLSAFNNSRSLQADVLYGEAELYLDGEFAGPTPFDSGTIKSRSKRLQMKSSERVYETEIDFNQVTAAAIKRDLGISTFFSSGRNIWVTSSDGPGVLAVVSDVSGATVLIDGTSVGKTPYSTSTLSDGEYDVKVELPGYEAQEERIVVQKGNRLSVSVNLFPTPVPAVVNLLPDSSNMYDLSSGNPAILNDTGEWAKAVVYWNKTRGINLAGIGVNRDLVFDYFLDYNGKLFNKEGGVIAEVEKLPVQPASAKIAYLGKKSDPVGFTTEARSTFLSLGVSPGASTADVPRIRVLETGTGWLRVRDQASLSGVEVARVDVGKEYVLLEENAAQGWSKIRVNDTTEGWVSSRYTTKVVSTSN